jgi:hypothetical protein
MLLVAVATSFLSGGVSATYPIIGTENYFGNFRRRNPIKAGYP